MNNLTLEYSGIFFGELTGPYSFSYLVEKKHFGTLIITEDSVAFKYQDINHVYHISFKNVNRIMKDKKRLFIEKIHGDLLMFIPQKNELETLYTTCVNLRQEYMMRQKELDSESKCIYCGNLISPQQKFCVVCGQKREV